MPVHSCSFFSFSPIKYFFKFESCRTRSRISNRYRALLLPAIQIFYYCTKSESKEICFDIARVSYKLGSMFVRGWNCIARSSKQYGHWPSSLVKVILQALQKRRSVIGSYVYFACPKFQKSITINNIIWIFLKDSTFAHASQYNC